MNETHTFHFFLPQSTSWLPRLQEKNNVESISYLCNFARWFIIIHWKSYIPFSNLSLAHEIEWVYHDDPLKGTDLVRENAFICSFPVLFSVPWNADQWQGLQQLSWAMNCPWDLLLSLGVDSAAVLGFFLTHSSACCELYNFLKKSWTSFTKRIMSSLSCFCMPIINGEVKKVQSEMAHFAGPASFRNPQ